MKILVKIDALIPTLILQKELTENNIEIVLRYKKESYNTEPYKRPGLPSKYF